MEEITQIQNVVNIIIDFCVRYSFQIVGALLILGILSSVSKIPTDPAPQIGIEKYADSSINIGMRYWVPTKEFYETLYAVNLSIYKQFKEANITIPYPQRDVHVVSGNEKMA